MGYIRLDEQPGEVYHYTHRKNLDSILRDGRIRRMGDRECWFCASLEDTLTLMRATVMMEGKPYYTPIDVFFTFDPDPVLDCKILPEEIPEYTVGVIGSWSGERKYLSREEVGQLLSASDPKTRILAEMLRYFEGKTWIVSCADCQEAFGILADAEMREAFGLDEQEQIGPKLEM